MLGGEDITVSSSFEIQSIPISSAEGGVRICGPQLCRTELVHCHDPHAPAEPEIRGVTFASNLIPKELEAFEKAAMAYSDVIL